MSQNFESAWQDYHNLCQRGGSLNFSELIQIANLKSPFEEEVFIDVSSFIFSEIMKKLDDFYQAKSA
jgi:oligoendopeptidase F